jgi:hypothetical protein
MNGEMNIAAKSNENLYNQAIRHMQNEMYEEAARCLRLIGKDSQLNSEAMWVAGLIDVLTGFPARALIKWDKINLGEDRKKLVDSIKQKLPLYQELYDTYNTSLQLISNNQLKLAEDLLEHILAFRWEVPLPIDFYHAYLLLKIVNGKDRSAFEALIDFPAYVRKSCLIQDLSEKLHQFLEECRTPESIFSQLPVRNKKAKQPKKKKSLFRTIFGN